MRRAILLSLAFFSGAALRGEDCNRNGVEDAVEIADGQAADCDGNGVPDGCDVAPPRIGFRLSQKLPTGAKPVDAEVGDLDGDGDKDLVVASADSRELTLYMNDGAGLFVETRSIHLRRLPTDTALADLDGDGLPDVATANLQKKPGSITVFWNVGDGRLEPGVELVTGPIQRAMTSADLDDDRDLDLAVANPRSKSVSIILNDGARGFEVSESVRTGDVSPWHVVAADLDGDGDTDLVARGSALVVLVNDGNARFPETRTFVEMGWSTLYSGDIDQDGAIDLIGTIPYGSDNQTTRLEIRIAWNDGTGAFLEDTLAGPWQDYPRVSAVTDFDGDGDLDISVVKSFSRPLDVIENQGHRKFSFLRGAAFVPRYVREAATGDFDGDGREDLILVGDDQTELFVLLQDPVALRDCDADGLPDDCTGRYRDCDQDGLDDTCGIALGHSDDCNQNGVPDSCDVGTGVSGDCNENTVPDECDIATGKSLDHGGDGIPDECERDCDRDGAYDHEELELGHATDCNGNASPDACDLASSPVFLEPSKLPGISFSGASFRVPIVIQDLDRDGDTDMAFSFGFAGGIDWIGIAWNLGNGGFVGETVKLDLLPRALVAADLDLDGDVDFVTANLSDQAGLPSNVTVLSNDGRFGFESRRNFALGPEPTEPTGLVAADVDGDGDPDLVSSAGPYLAFFENLRAAGFRPANLLDMAVGVSTVSAADLDDDGTAELIVTLPQSRDVVVLRYSAAGLTEIARFDLRFDLSEGVSPLAVADIDGDADPDVAVAAEDRIFVLRNSSGTLEPWTTHRLPVSSPFYRMAAGDPDGDGDSDIVVVGLYKGIALLENHGAGSFVARKVLEQAPSTRTASLADLDGDGLDDLVFGNRVVAFSRLGPSSDCDGNLVPDECQADCDENGIADSCDIAAGGDCNRNGLPDACDVAPRLSLRPSAELELPAGIHGGVRQLVLLDFDRDGMKDIFAATWPSRVAVFRNLGGFLFEPLEPFQVLGEISSYTLADLDLDGDDDMALGSRWLTILKNDGSRLKHDQAFEVREFFLGTAVTVVSLASGDLDGDRDLDLTALIARSRSGAILVLRNRGNGSFEVTDDPVPVGCCAGAQALLDADSDGDLDLLVEGTDDCTTPCSPRWTLLRNRGDATFETASVEGPFEELVRNTGITADSATVSAALVSGVPDQTDGDIDGDGLIDRVDPRRSKVLFARADGTYVGRTIPLVKPGTALGLGDLDGDGDPDLVGGSTDQSSPHTLHLFRNDTLPALSSDTNSDGVPDECDPRIPFHRGDPDGDGRIALADGISILRSLFLDGEPPRCRESADFGNDGRIGLTDPVALFRFLFLGGPPPEFPGPPDAPCGRDADPPGSARDLGCEVYEGC